MLDRVQRPETSGGSQPHFSPRVRETGLAFAGRPFPAGVGHLHAGLSVLLCSLFAVALALAGVAPAAHANRFGPPWQSRVVADSTLVYSGPDRAAAVVGPLPRDAVVVVLGESKDKDGADWTAIPDGFVPSSDVEEWAGTWVAEVAVPSVSVYARPMAGGEIRRTARLGDLLRVTGVSPGLEGDTGIWWSTTEGYLAMRTLRAASNEWAAAWTLPAPSEAPDGWWGAISSAANVRAAPTTKAAIVGELPAGARVKVLASLTLVQDGQPLFTTYVALGKAGVDTPTGSYSTLGKYRADDMTSTSVPDADHSYDLPNVPYTQYYREGGYAIHGTYWHDFFATLQSQGCVNLTVTDAAYLFDQTRPEVPADVNARWIDKLLATPVVIVG